jgi:hypothetical protein
VAINGVSLYGTALGGWYLLRVFKPRLLLEDVSLGQLVFAIGSSKWFHKQLVCKQLPLHPQDKSGSWTGLLFQPLFSWKAVNFSSLSVSPQWSNVFSFSPGCSWATPPPPRLSELIALPHPHKAKVKSFLP